MGTTMSRQNICFTEDPHVVDAHRAVQCMVRFFRGSGHKNERALELAAQALDITPRRAWALRYLTQPVRVMRVQRDLLLHRLWSHMDHQAAQLRAQADALERQAEAERLATAQLSLPLDTATCSKPSARGSSSGVGDAR